MEGVAGEVMVGITRPSESFNDINLGDWMGCRHVYNMRFFSLMNLSSFAQGWKSFDGIGGHFRLSSASIESQRGIETGCNMWRDEKRGFIISSEFYTSTIA